MPAAAAREELAIVVMAGSRVKETYVLREPFSYYALHDFCRSYHRRELWPEGWMRELRARPKLLALGLAAAALLLLLLRRRRSTKQHPQPPDEVGEARGRAPPRAVESERRPERREPGALATPAPAESVARLASLASRAPGPAGKRKDD